MNSSRNIQESNENLYDLSSTPKTYIDSSFERSLNLTDNIKDKSKNVSSSLKDKLLKKSFGFIQRDLPKSEEKDDDNVKSTNTSNIDQKYNEVDSCDLSTPKTYIDSSCASNFNLVSSTSVEDSKNIYDENISAPERKSFSFDVTQDEEEIKKFRDSHFKQSENLCSEQPEDLHFEKLEEQPEISHLEFEDSCFDKAKDPESKNANFEECIDSQESKDSSSVNSKCSNIVDEENKKDSVILIAEESIDNTLNRGVMIGSESSFSNDSICSNVSTEKLEYSFDEESNEYVEDKSNSKIFLN